LLEDELVAALLASAKADLDAAVAAGQITAAQAAVGSPPRRPNWSSS
jgi:hypothetical protein